VAAKRLNIDWDSAAEIENTDDKDDTEVPAAVVCFLNLFLKVDCDFLISIWLLTLRNQAEELIKTNTREH
jgi:hypothetical protein